jgi:hypothetical protein
LAKTYRRFLYVQNLCRKDNKPAEYSKDNVPYVPKHYLPVSIKDKKKMISLSYSDSREELQNISGIAVEKIMKKSILQELQYEMLR